MRMKIFNIYFLSLLGVILIAVASRPFSIGSDTLDYVFYYTRLINNFLPNYDYEFLFSAISKVTAFFAFPTPFFFAIISLINCCSFVVLAKMLIVYLNQSIESYKLLLLLFFFLCVSPFFFSTQVNVLRQGLAITVLLIFYISLLNKSHFLSLALVALISLGFHKTSIIYLFLFPLFYFSYIYVLRMTLVLFCIYISGAGRSILYYCAFALYDKITNYGALSNYKQGIRYDFAFFSLGVGLLFHFLNKYYLQDLEQKRFSSLLKIYWMLILPFFIFGFGPYSDRYLLPAWVYISVLAAVFSGLFLKRFNYSIFWYYIGSIFSSVYFILRVQGVIG